MLYFKIQQYYLLLFLINLIKHIMCIYFDTNTNAALCGKTCHCICKLNHFFRAEACSRQKILCYLKHKNDKFISTDRQT